MLLGKRPRPPMKRTTSMSGIAFDLNTTLDDDPNNPAKEAGSNHPPVGFNGLDESRVWATISPRSHIRHSDDSSHTPHFLRVCFLCKRRLVPGHDIYMYKGDSAFCSSECREQQMNQDGRKDKYRVASKKQVSATPNSGSQIAATSL